MCRSKNTQLEEQNKARRMAGLPEIKEKKRKCLKCKVEFTSVNEYTCKDCKKTNFQTLATTDDESIYIC